MKIRCWVLFAVLLWPLLQAACAAEPLQKKVLIIGVDGTRLDALAVARTPSCAMPANGASVIGTSSPPYGDPVGGPSAARQPSAEI